MYAKWSIFLIKYPIKLVQQYIDYIDVLLVESYVIPAKKIAL